jgi:hypothetical protein
MDLEGGDRAHTDCSLNNADAWQNRSSVSSNILLVREVARVFAQR